jgi:hypothetical protein
MCQDWQDHVSIDVAGRFGTAVHGQYVASLPTDSPKQVGTHVVWELLDKGRKFETHLPNQADSEIPGGLPLRPEQNAPKALLAATFESVACHRNFCEHKIDLLQA